MAARVGLAELGAAALKPGEVDGEGAAVASAAALGGPADPEGGCEWLRRMRSPAPPRATVAAATTSTVRLRGLGATNDGALKAALAPVVLCSGSVLDAGVISDDAAVDVSNDCWGCRTPLTSTGEASRGRPSDSASASTISRALGNRLLGSRWHACRNHSSNAGPRVEPRVDGGRPARKGSARPAGQGALLSNTIVPSGVETR